MNDNNLSRRLAKLRRSRSSFFVSVHYAAERFAVLLVLAGVVIAGTLSVVFFDDRARRDEIFEKTIVYTSVSSSSKTNQNMSVEGVWRSENSRRAFVLLRWQNTNNIPLSVRDYHVFVGARESDESAKRPSVPVSGGVVTYGQSGYVGIVLNYSRSIPMEMADITVRLLSQVSNGSDGSEYKWSFGETSFADYDQVRIMVNPGVSTVPVSQSLSKDHVDLVRVYEEHVLAPQETELRDQADQLLVTLSDDLLAIEEYEKRAREVVFEGNHIVVPERNDQIAGDEITCTTLEASDSAENQVASCDLSSHWTAKGLWDFNWRSMSLVKGYIDPNFPDADVTQREYKDFVSDQFDQGKNLTMPRGQWFFTDGSEITVSDNIDTSGRTDDGSSIVSSSVTQVENARQKFFQDKVLYQRDVMYKLLQLSIMDGFVRENYSVVWGDEALSMIGVES